MPPDLPVRLTCTECAVSHDLLVTDDPASTAGARAFFVRHGRCTTAVDGALLVTG